MSKVDRWEVEKERMKSLRIEYETLLLRFNSTQTLRFISMAGFLGLQVWLLNTLMPALVKFSEKPARLEAIVMLMLLVVHGLGAKIANALELSFSRGLTENLIRGIELEKLLGHGRGISTMTRESFIYSFYEPRSITWAFNKTQQYLNWFWGLYSAVINIHIARVMLAN